MKGMLLNCKLPDASRGQGGQPGAHRANVSCSRSVLGLTGPRVYVFYLVHVSAILWGQVCHFLPF